MDRRDAANPPQSEGYVSRPTGQSGSDVLRSVGAVAAYLAGAAALWGGMLLPLAPTTRVSAACFVGLLLYFSGLTHRANAHAPASIRLSLGMTALYLAASAAVSLSLPALFEQPPPAFARAGAQLFPAAVLLLTAMRAWQVGSALACAVGLLLSVHLQAVFLATPAAGWMTWAWFTAAILLIAIAAGYFAGSRRRIWMLWIAPTAVCGHMLVFLWHAPPDGPWQWTAAGMIGIVAYLLLTAHGIDIDARSMSLECGLRLLSNTALFGVFAWVAADAAWPGQDWIGIGLTALLIVAVGMLARLAGGAESLVTFYLAKAAVALAVALVLVAPAAARTPVIAGTAIIPLILYRVYPGRPFHVPALLPAPLALMAALLLQMPPGHLVLGPMMLNHGWASLLGTVGVLVLLARWCAVSTPAQEHSSRTKDIEKGMSLTYAAAASLIMTTHIILTRGDTERLPIILACQALVFVGLGMLLAAPAVMVAAITPLMAVAALAFVFSPLVSDPLVAAGAISLPENLILFVTAIGIAAYAESWVREDRGKHPAFTSQIAIGTAYLPMVGFLVNGIAASGLGEVRYVPVVLNSAALVLFLLALTTGLTVLRAVSACMMLTAAGAGVFISMFWPGNASGLQWHIPALLLFQGEYLVVERLSFRFPWDQRRRTRFLSAGWVVVAVLTGVTGLHDWNNGPVLFVGLLGLAGCFFVLGRMTRERAYHYGALALTVIAAAGWAFFDGGGAA